MRSIKLSVAALALLPGGALGHPPAPVPVPAGEQGALTWRAAPPLVPDTEPLPAAATARLGRWAAQTNVLAFSPDGKYLATTHGGDFRLNVPYAIHVWDVRAGKHLRVLDGARTGVLCAAFAPDGDTLAGGGMDNTLRFWGLKTGKQLDTGHAHNGHVYAVSFSADGKLLATGSDELRLWDATRREEIQKFSLPRRERIPEYFFQVALSPDGKRLASGSEKHIHFWDAVTGRLVRVVEDRVTVRERLLFSANGKTLVGGAAPGGLVRQWDAETGKPLTDGPRLPKGTWRVAFAADLRTMAWAAAATPDRPTNSEVAVGDAAPVKESRRVHIAGELISFALSPDGKTLAVGGTDGSLGLWETTGDKGPRRLVEPPQSVFALHYAPDGKRVFALTGDGSLHDWDASIGKELGRRPLPIPAGDMLAGLSADGKVLATRSKTGTLRLWSILTGKQLSSVEGVVVSRPEAGPANGQVLPGMALPDHLPGAGFAFSPDGRTAAALTGDDKAGPHAVVWEVAGGKKVAEFRTAPRTCCLALSADGRTLFTAARNDLYGEQQDNAIRIWNLATGKERRQIANPVPAPGPRQRRAGFVRALLPSADGKHLAVIEEVITITFAPFGAPGVPPVPVSSWSVQLLVADTGKALQRFPDGRYQALAFSPDGKTFVCGRSHGVAIADLPGGTVGGSNGHHGWVNAVAFAPDGKSLASGSGDDTILLWDAAKLLKGPIPR